MDREKERRHDSKVSLFVKMLNMGLNSSITVFFLLLNATHPYYIRLLRRDYQWLTEVLLEALHLTNDLRQPLRRPIA